MKYFLIMNPGSRSGQSHSKFTKILEYFDSIQANYDYHITEKLKDAYEYSMKANLSNYDVIVAVGGDGTINSVINGFFNDQGNRFSNSKLAVIYTGTSPDFCKSYNIPIDLDSSLQLLKNIKTKKIDIGRIEFLSSGKEAEVKYFACCSNIGIGANIARLANTGMRKVFGYFLGTLISLIRSVVFFKATDLNLRIDGKDITIQKAYNISVGITKFIASGIKVNAAKSGNFYLMVAQKINLLNLLPLLIRVYSGKSFKNTAFLNILHAENVEIHSENLNTEVEFDGDPAGHLPIKINLISKTLDLIC